MWSQTVNDINGDWLFNVQASGYAWARRISAVSEGTATLQMKDIDRSAGITPAEAAQLMIPNARTLVNWWDGVPFVASTLIDFDYSRSSGEMLIQHADIRYFAGKRFTFGVDGYESGTLAVAGKSKRGMYRAIARAIYGDKSPRWELPVDVGPDETGPYGETFNNYNLQLGEEIFAAIEASTDGPHSDYRPYSTGLNGDGIRYELRLGNPLLTGGFKEYTLSAPEAETIDVRYRIAGKRQLTGVIATGKGSGSDIRIGKAPFLDGAYPVPIMDAKTSAKDESDTARLNDRATAELQGRRDPTTQWGVTLPMSEAVNLPPGSILSLFEDSDPVIPHGTHNLYVLGLSGDIADGMATMEVQEL